MRGSGASVTGAIKEIIARNRSVHDCLKMDLINYTALAVKIQPEVEGMLGSPVNLNTIVVAIKRYADSFEPQQAAPEEAVLKNARILLTDGIVDIRFSAKGPGTIDPAEILDRFSRVTDNYEFFRMPGSFRLLAEDMEDVRGALNDVGEEAYSTGLAKIRVVMPRAQNRSDVVSYVAEILHMNGIEVVNAFFGQDGITIILNRSDAPRAYGILHTDIMKNSPSL